MTRDAYAEVEMAPNVQADVLVEALGAEHTGDTL